MATAEARELSKAGQRPGILSRQAGEPFISYISKLWRCCKRSRHRRKAWRNLWKHLQWRCIWSCIPSRSRRDKIGRSWNPRSSRWSRRRWWRKWTTTNDERGRRSFRPRRRYVGKFTTSKPSEGWNIQKRAMAENAKSSKNIREIA